VNLRIDDQHKVKSMNRQGRVKGHKGKETEATFAPLR
jgi:hypothetical protein